jgi:hypothetical protein
VCQRRFHEQHTIDDLVRLHQEMKQIDDEHVQLTCQSLNERIEQFTRRNQRDESTQLNATWITINKRATILTQDMKRFRERLNERIDNETSNSMKICRTLIDNLRMKLTRTVDDNRLSIDVKQRVFEVNNEQSSHINYVHDDDVDFVFLGSVACVEYRSCSC